MYKKRILTCLTLVVMVVALAGIFFYMSHVKDSQPRMDGTFVKAFSQDVKEYCL